MSALTCSKGFTAAAFTSVTLMMWKPKSLSTTSLISPGFILKTASSKGFTIIPLPKNPRSPPCAAEPGSREFSRASFSKSPGLDFTCASSCSAFFFARLPCRRPRA